MIDIAVKDGLKPRVLIAVSSLAPRFGGPSRSVPALAAALRKTNAAVDVLSWDIEGINVEAIRAAQLVHDQGLWLWTNHRVAYLARHIDIPRIVSVRGMLEPWALNHHRWKKRVAWHLYQRRDLETAAVIHVTSEAEAENVRRTGLINPLAVIPNGIVCPEPLPPRATQDRRRALFLSRLHPKKGLSLLVKVWETVRPHDWELVIAGPDEGGHSAEVEALVRQARLGSSVRFIGSVTDDDKWDLYRSADLFILPTHSENFGIVVAEALACEVPVITTKGAPWQELVTHGCGWWTDVNADALALAMREAFDLSDEQRRAMGARGRRLVKEKYAWNQVAKEMSLVYGWILGKNKKPSSIQLS